MSDHSSYFSDQHGKAARPGRLISVLRDLPDVDVIPGLNIRPLFGSGFSVNFVRWRPETEAPEHAHIEEQLIVMIDGELQLEFEGETHNLRAGELALLPAWVPHRARTLGSPAYQLDVFCPPRQSVIDMLVERGIALG